MRSHIKLIAQSSIVLDSYPTQTTPVKAGGGAVSTPMSRVPSSLFGCISNPSRYLGGANVVFRYNAAAEVDCRVDGVAGVKVVIYMLCPNTNTMNAAFDKVFVGKAARPRAGLGCGTKNFVTGVGYRVGDKKSTAGSYVRFF